MKECTTKDEFDDADKAFFQAHTVLATGAGDLEKAAATVTEYALTSGDKGAIAFFLARFADFVEAGRLPPLAMRKGFRCVIEAINTKNKAKGNSRRRPKMPLLEREWARTHARLVAHFVNSGDSPEEAIEKVVGLRAAHVRQTAKMRGVSNYDTISVSKASASKIKRDYLKFRKLKK